MVLPRRFQSVLVVVDAFDGLEELEIVPQFLGDADESAQVLREAETAEADAGVEEVLADAAVEAHAERDLLDVGLGQLAKAADGVDEGDLGREERIRSVLDDLGALDVGEDHRRLERLIEVGEDLSRLLGLDAQDHAVGVHEILHGAPLPQELGVRGDVELRVLASVATERPLDPFAGLDGDGALLDDELVSVELVGHGARDVLDEAQVRLAVGPRRRADGDEDHRALSHRRAKVRGEGKVALLHVVLHELFEARLVDGHAAFFERGDLLGVDVDADHVVAEARETSAGDQSDVAAADYGNLHIFSGTGVAVTGAVRVWGGV
jgi:hypothetical protein